jgi:purine-binding chemotaxis protein CheW
MENSQITLEKFETEHKTRILKERAAILAKPIETIIEGGKQLQGLCFLLSDEQYIIDTDFVVEVLPLNELTPLPCTPPFLLGIINVRGRILSVVNLKNFFNLPEKGITNLNRVIIVKNDDIELGLLVDEVLGNCEIFTEQLQPDLPTLNKGLTNYLIGVQSDFSVVIDIAKFLADEKIIINEEV